MPTSRIAEFVIRACHDRHLEVYHDRLNRWESATLFDLVATVPFQFEQKIRFTHARHLRTVRTGFAGILELWVFTS